MKKIFFPLILLALFLPTVSLAVPTGLPVPTGVPTGYEGVPPEAPNIDIIGLIFSITNWLFWILLLVAVIFIIIAAYSFVTATGDPEKIKTARNFVMYALIGVLVAFAAKGLVDLVGEITGWGVVIW
jgi:hypothetical protein